MTITNQNGEPVPPVRPAGQQHKNREVNMQMLAEKILKLLKKEARLERERQGPR